MPDHAVRALGIGGTDVAAIFGWDRYRDAHTVWAEKMGKQERTPPSPRMKLGKYFERGIIEYYSAETGHPVKFLDITMQAPGREWMVYTPDAICLDEPRGIDAKLVQWDQRHLWGPTEYDIPIRVQTQCRWYMACADFPFWDVAAVLGDDLVVYTIERDVALEAGIVEHIEEWYQRHIVGGEEPPMGPTEGSERFLKEHFPRNKLMIREADEGEAALLDHYTDVREKDRELQSEKDALENQIKFAIGHYDGLTWPRGKFTWKNTKDSQKVEWEALATSLMKRYEADDRQGLIQQFTTMKPGVRRMDFRPDKNRG
jgi:predicted phage-related endonuclease